MPGQDINWSLVIIPSLIVGFLAIGAQIISTYWLSKITESYKKDLSKEIEDYKAEISKELESYKFQLQASFQTKFYEFQTKFSLWHQRRSDVVEKIYGHIA